MSSWDDVEPEKNGIEYDDTPRVPPTRSQAVRMNEDVITSLTHRMAALTVRRMCNQPTHQCRPAADGGPCGHHNHHRDAGLLLPEMLETLGLPLEVPVVSDEDKKNWLSGLKDVSKPVTLDDLDGTK